MKKGSTLVLFLTIFIDLLGFGLVIPFLPYFARELGATGKTTGLVVGVFSLMQFFFSPFWGRLSDRIGRRPVLLISLSGSVAGYTVLAFAHSMPQLFLSRIVAGIAGANIGTAQAYIADTTTPENRARGMGLIGAAFGLGFILGPPLGGFLSHASVAAGHSVTLYPGIAATCLSLVALTTAIFALPESRPPGQAIRGWTPPQFDANVWRYVRSTAPIALSLLAIFIVILCFASMETSVTLTARDDFGFTQMDLAWIFLFMGFIVASIQGGALGRLARRFGERRVVIAGATSLSLGLALVPFVPSAPLLFVPAGLIAMGQGMCYPSLVSLLTRYSRPADHGSVLGLSSSIGSASRMAGPVLGGSLYDGYGTPGAFLVPAVVVLGTIACAAALPAPEQGKEFRIQDSE